MDTRSKLNIFVLTECDQQHRKIREEICSTLADSANVYYLKDDLSLMEATKFHPDVIIQSNKEKRYYIFEEGFIRQIPNLDSLAIAS